MKRILIAMAIAMSAIVNAHAADKGGPSLASMIKEDTGVSYRWTGCYMGAHVGFMVVDNGASVPGAPAGLGIGAIEADAGMAGVHAGCDMRLGASRFIIGAFGEYSAMFDAESGISVLGGLVTGEYDIEHTLSASVRAGYLITDSFMAFVYGGYTHGYTSDLSIMLGGTKVAEVSMPDLKGWHVGAGAEYRIADHWSVTADYRLTEWDAETIQNTVKFNNRDHALKIGARYRF